MKNLSEFFNNPQRVLSGGDAKILKSSLGDNSINQKNWGVEYADNALDAGAGRCTFHILEEFPTKTIQEIPRPKLIKISNTGKPLSMEDAIEKLFSIPLTTWDRSTNSIGLYGHGATDSSFAVGYIKEVESFNVIDGKEVPYKLMCVPCIDEFGKIPHPSLGSMKHSEMQSEVQSYTLFTTPVETSPNEPFSITIEFFEDSNVSVDKNSLETAMSLRYSQLNTFVVRVKNTSGSPETHYDGPIRKTYFGNIDANGNLVTSVEQINKIPEKFVFEGIEWEVSYCTAISEDDYDKHKKFTSRVGDGLVLELEESRDKGWPLFSIMNSQGVVMTVLPKGFAFGKGYSYDSAKHLRLRFFLKPLNNVSGIFAQNKANGLKNDKYQREMGIELKRFLKKHDIRSEYAGTRQKTEDSRVEQFIEKITGSTTEGHLLAYNFKDLLPNLDINKLRDIDQWVTFSKDSSGREIDARNESVRLMMEFQEGTGDVTHLDGIVGRSISTMRLDSMYDSLIWVAEKHTSHQKNRLVQQLKGIKWEDTDTCLKKIYFMTTQDLIDGFDAAKIKSIDIVKDIIEPLEMSK